MQPDEHQAGPQSLTRDWIIKVLETSGWTPHRLAKEAGLSPATIHRALNDDFVTSNTTLEKISKATGIPSPLASHATGRPGFREPDGTPLSEGSDDLAPGQERWILKTRAAELAGYLPGDILTVDATVEPRAGDLVLAQSYDLQLDTAETVFRVYDRPFLVVRTMDPSISAKPLTVDDRSVVIVGTVVRSVRERSK